MYFLHLEGSQISIRHARATLDDAYCIMGWRNSASARAAFFSTDVVTPDTHMQFMANRKPHDLVFIAEFLDKPIGMTALKVDVVNHSAECGRTYIDKKYRRQGHGTDLDRITLYYAFDLLRLDWVWREVFVDNKAAISLCQKTGWQDEGINVPGHTNPRGPVLYQIYRREWWNKT